MKEIQFKGLTDKDLQNEITNLTIKISTIKDCINELITLKKNKESMLNAYHKDLMLRLDNYIDNKLPEDK